MNQSANSARSTSRTALRVVLLLGCIGLTVAATASVRAWQANRDGLVALLASGGIDDLAVIETVRREGTPHHARLAAARAIVYQQLSAPPLVVPGAADAGPAARPAGALILNPREREQELDRRRRQLDTAHTLASEGMAAQPNSWQAAMLLGATTYLRWSIDRDPRLFTDADTWQQPLLTALRDAPGQPEPRRLLATAYLELWPALSPDKKRFARDLLQQTFAEDPDAFERLGPTWMTTASTIEDAFEIVPETQDAWQLLAKRFAKDQQWHRFREAHERMVRALETELEARLADGLQRLSLGDDFHSRTRFARVVAEAPQTLRFAPLVNRALAHYPPGLQAAGTGTALRDWLAWAIELDRIWVAPLTPPNVARLATIAERLPPPEAALAALLGGDLALAERLERLELSVRSSAWAPYLMAKARHFLDRELIDDARAALDDIEVGSRHDAVYDLLRLRLARAAGNDDTAAQIEVALGTHRDSAWPARAWRRQKQGFDRLAVLTTTAAEGMVIEVAEASAAGSVAEIRFDGAVVHTVAVYPGTLVELSVAASPDKPSWLEWRTLAGEPTRPGAVRVR